MSKLVQLKDSEGNVYPKTNTIIKYLWSGTDNATGDKTLNDKITNYNFILVGISAEGYSKNSMLIPVSDIVYSSSASNTYEIEVFQTSSTNVSIQFEFTNDSTLKLRDKHNANWRSAYLRYVIGIKFN